MLRQRHVPTWSLAIAASLCLAGCCGGYAVVQTRLSAVPPTTGEPGATGGHLLHYSRVGEPPSSCGSSEKYTEDLWVRIPALRQGEAFAIGAPGVTAIYAHDHGPDKESTKRVSGTVTLVELKPGAVVARLDVRVVLRAGDVVSLDDEYAFHPAR